MMRKLIVKYLPFIGAYKRMMTAVLHKQFVKKSYSQHEEDVFFLEYFKENKLNKSDWTFIDVGANHPTDISNTFLLYKHGLKGIIVEPNKELIRLFKWFRPGDLRLQLGCSNSSSVLQFYVSKTPVISSFENEWMDSEVYDSYFVPVMKLDEAVQKLLSKKLFLLSIDVEGLNMEVLEGGLETVKKTLFLCIEFDSEKDIEKYKNLIGEEFELVFTKGCNAIFKNLAF